MPPKRKSRQYIGEFKHLRMSGPEIASSSNGALEVAVVETKDHFHANVAQFRPTGNISLSASSTHFTDNLAQQCSWRGTPTKKCIRGMLLTLAIRTAFTKKFALEEAEFDRVSQKFFQYAHDRLAKVDKYTASKKAINENAAQQHEVQIP